MALTALAAAETAAPGLPERFAGWFAGRGWRPHAHQIALLDAVGRGEPALVIAPTGGGNHQLLVTIAADPLR